MASNLFAIEHRRMQYTFSLEWGIQLEEPTPFLDRPITEKFINSSSDNWRAQYGAACR